MSLFPHVPFLSLPFLTNSSTSPPFEFRVPTHLTNRKEQKRSHTLRYVLKNRATNRVLFVVLFTLYLKEDVDEEGNIKEGVEENANKPFELRDEETKKKHGRGMGGSWWWGGGDGTADEDGEEIDEKVVENGKTTPVETNGDDDVD